MALIPFAKQIIVPCYCFVKKKKSCPRLNHMVQWDNQEFVHRASDPPLSFSYYSTSQPTLANIYSQEKKKSNTVLVGWKILINIYFCFWGILGFNYAMLEIKSFCGESVTW